MFIKVKYGSDNMVLVNPNCVIKLIYEYLRVTASVPDNCEVDLMDEQGNLAMLYNQDSSSSGLHTLVPRTTYYIVLYDRSVSGTLINKRVLISKSHKSYKTLMSKLYGMDSGHPPQREISKSVFANVKGKLSPRYKQKSERSKKKSSQQSSVNDEEDMSNSSEINVNYTLENPKKKTKRYIEKTGDEDGKYSKKKTAGGKLSGQGKEDSVENTNGKQLLISKLKEKSREKMELTADPLLRRPEYGLEIGGEDDELEDGRSERDTQLQATQLSKKPLGNENEDILQPSTLRKKDKDGEDKNMVTIMPGANGKNTNLEKKFLGSSNIKTQFRLSRSLSMDGDVEKNKKIGKPGLQSRIGQGKGRYDDRNFSSSNGKRPFVAEKSSNNHQKNKNGRRSSKKSESGKEKDRSQKMDPDECITNLQDLKKEGTRSLTEIPTGNRGISDADYLILLEPQMKFKQTHGTYL